MDGGVSCPPAPWEPVREETTTNGRDRHPRLLGVLGQEVITRLIIFVVVVVIVCCSNLYRDSEGTLGHEFYEEEILVDEQTGTVRRGMKRITENLTPEASSINSNKLVSICGSST